ncbi:4-hydroxythreonine-4-phosphate dehydrogenase PdxA [Arthrobacter sp. SA17]
MKPIALTMGDPSGIGPEIVMKLMAEPGLNTPALVIGDVGVLNRAAKQSNIPLEARPITLSEFRPDASFVQVLAVTELPVDLPLGKVLAQSGQAAFDYVKAGIEAALVGEVSALVTAPINKEAMRLAGLPYPGHTEILAELSNCDDYTMMMSSDDLRVVLVTIHESLKNAIELVTMESILRAIRLAHTAMVKAGIAEPRIGVAGLNPHAGENGLMGTEELEIIQPAVEKAIAEGISASGPWPPDTVFLRARQGHFDVVIAQYHDQGLIPFKYLGLERGVNVTIGLPFVRTSVDHGTAFDIVGQGIADHRSLLVALRHAVLMAGGQ